MVTTTTTYSFKKPTVGDDEDLWGGYLNDSMDLIDDVLDGTTPVTGIDINSGTIDNTVIGGTTPVAGTFTALTANTSLGVTGNITVSGTVDGVDIATRDGVLTTTTTTANAALPKAGGTMTGTLTGTSAVFSGDLTVDTNTLYVDSTNNRVGIGTSSPNAPTAIVATTTTYEGLELITPSGDGSGEFHIGVHQNGSTAGRSIVFKRGGSDGMDTESMRIDASGSVGIGTSSPDTALEISTSGSGVTDVLKLTTTASNSVPAILFEADAGSIQHDAARFRVGQTDQNNSSMIFEVQGSGSLAEAMRIESSGQIGIGTSSPSAKVHSVDSNGNVLRLQRDGAFTGSWDVDIGSYTTGDFTIYDNENSQRAISIAKLTGFSDTSAIRIESNGSVVTTKSLTVGDGLDINNGNGSQTHWNYANGNENYIRGTNTTFDTPIDMNSNNIDDVANIYVQSNVYHHGDTDTYVGFVTNGINLVTGNTTTAFNPNGVFITDGSLAEDYDALSGTSPTCNVDSAGAFSLTMTGNTTFTFSGADSGYSQGFILQLTGNGSTVTWPSSVDWAGGTAPDAPASGETDILVFFTRDGGTTWYGVQSIDAAS